jgi:MoxR-like ATPase
MDRFLLATRLGYPDEVTETKLALSHGAQPSLASLSPVCTPIGLAAAQAAVAEVPVASSVAQYAVAVVRATRADPFIRLGASPRAAIGLLAAARAHAVIAGRGFVLPDDVKAVAVSVLAHRLVTEAAPVGAFEAGIAAVQAILERVPSPRP